MDWIGLGWDGMGWVALGWVWLDLISGGELGGGERGEVEGKGLISTGNPCRERQIHGYPTKGGNRYRGGGGIDTADQAEQTGTQKSVHEREIH